MPGNLLGVAKFPYRNPSWLREGQCRQLHRYYVNQWREPFRDCWDVDEWQGGIGSTRGAYDSNLSAEPKDGTGEREMDSVGRALRSEDYCPKIWVHYLDRPMPKTAGCDCN